MILGLNDRIEDCMRFIGVLEIALRIKWQGWLPEAAVVGPDIRCVN